METGILLPVAACQGLERAHTLGSCSPSCHLGLCCLLPASAAPSAARLLSAVSLSRYCLCSVRLCLFPVLQLCSVRLCSTLPLEAPLTAGVCSDVWARGAFLCPGLSSCICVASLLTSNAPQSLGSLPPPKACSLPAARPPHHDAPAQPQGTSSPRRDRGLRDPPGVKQILQRPLTDLGHLPGGAGAPLGDTAATCFAV